MSLYLGTTPIADGASTALLAGKADTDLSNTIPANSFVNALNTTGFRKLVEIYKNGSSWYKVFREYNPSNGTLIGLWCEQGGQFTNTNTTFSVTLLKAFGNTNYSVLVTLGENNKNSNFSINVGQKNSGSFTGAMSSSTTTYKSSWQAYGYIS